MTKSGCPWWFLPAMRGDPSSSSSPYPGLHGVSSMDIEQLDFRPGIIFEDYVRLRLGSLVCPSWADFPSAFILVVSFERCVFRLSHGSVGFLLQASLGGSADVFCVSQLADRVFRFSVYSKTVGFHISMLKIIDRPEFRAFFSLWNFGGSNWISKFRNYLKEEDSSWRIIRGKKPISYADAVNNPPLSGQMLSLSSGRMLLWCIVRMVFLPVAGPQSSRDCLPHHIDRASWDFGILLWQRRTMRFLWIFLLVGCLLRRLSNLVLMAGFILELFTATVAGAQLIGIWIRIRRGHVIFNGGPSRLSWSTGPMDFLLLRAQQQRMDLARPIFSISFVKLGLIWKYFANWRNKDLISL